MRLEDLGQERGERNEPPSISTSLDDIEAAIIERVEMEKKQSHGALEDELRTYSERLSSLDFEGKFAAIRHAAPACVGEFKAEVAKGLDDLHSLRDNFREAHNERDEFRRTHNLSRSARVQGRASTLLKIAILVCIFVFETILNGQFLAVGNESGLLGGIALAFSFAFVNITCALILALFGVVQLNHRSLLRKLIGFVSLAFYIAVALGLNLALAHYRDVSAILAENPGRLVMERMRHIPLQLDDVNSWVFLAIGTLFSLIAFIDGLFLSDPYPGFAATQKRLEERRAAYSRGRRALIDRLSDIRDDYRDEMEELNRDLSVRRGEHDAILTNRARFIQLFAEHQNQLERTATLLLSTYREANKAARSTKPPKRFSAPYKLQRIPVVASMAGEWRGEELRDRILATQDVLTEQVGAIHREFENAVDRYRQLDELVPEQRASDVAPSA
ncbi:hypothetical protein NKH37_18945 [Mesorhizobium sp. M1217]|uniref:hypothetical protein n=1 Tax=Mesorhizobium sp. M1217 TaxID=2957070 RepID=UPI00333A6198